MQTVTNSTPDLKAALGDDAACAELIAHLWRGADVLGHYPATTETAVEILRVGGGFDASVDLLTEWFRRGMVPGVQYRGGRLAWNARDILTAMIHLDTWRRFIPLDSRHIHKLTAVELAEHQANVAGTTAFKDIDDFDVQAFLMMIDRCGDAQVRHALVIGLKTKLNRVSPGVLDK